MSTEARITLSFYRYVRIEDPMALADSLRAAWSGMGVLGRIYVAGEGINAQLCVPKENLQLFENHVREIFPEMPFKIALEDKAPSFNKLKIKIRTKLVADGLEDGSFDSSQVGQHLNAQQFHMAMESPDTVVVDMRNHYECEVGHFEGALLPTANTFREALPEVLDMLKGCEERKVLLYCTGGIRCEKASAWLKFHGFRDVNQLHGGIIDYARQVAEDGSRSRFVGKNFVFDGRMGERITDDVISHCHQCGESCDEHTNCDFDGCNRLFIQCDQCRAEFQGCCSITCREILAMPREEQVRIQQEWEKQAGPKHYWSRTRLAPEMARSSLGHAVFKP